jgi:UDP-N-acetylmuramate dehydrogenase
VGGYAQYFAKPTDIPSIFECIAWAKTHNLPIWLLGGGSNILIAEEGLGGLVLQPAISSLRAQDEQEDVLVTAGAGCSWDALVAWSVEQGLAGIECLSGIPGFVGAAPIQNIGAYGQEVSEVFVEAMLWDQEAMMTVIWDAQAWRFSYRHSRLKEEGERGRYIVLSITLRLRRDGRPSLRYRDLQEAFAGQPAPTLRAVRESVIAIRKQKSMVLDSNDPNTCSAGSFFTNPIVSEKEADLAEEALSRRAGETLKMPRYPTEETGRCKLSAAWLIERSGIPKGYGEGAVGISTQHTLALVNRGGAKAEDIIAFARQIQRRVQTACGILLHPEVQWIGFAKEKA